MKYTVNSSTMIAYTSFGTYEDTRLTTSSSSTLYRSVTVPAEGARIGCLISKNDEFTSQINKFCQARLCVPEVEQIGAAALYDTPKSYTPAGQ